MTDQKHRKLVAAIKVPPNLKNLTAAERDAWIEQTYWQLREQAQKKKS